MAPVLPTFRYRRATLLALNPPRVRLRDTFFSRKVLVRNDVMDIGKIKNTGGSVVATGKIVAHPKQEGVVEMHATVRRLRPRCRHHNRTCKQSLSSNSILLVYLGHPVLRRG